MRGGAAASLRPPLSQESPSFPSPKWDINQKSIMGHLGLTCLAVSKLFMISSHYSMGSSNFSFKYNELLINKTVDL